MLVGKALVLARYLEIALEKNHAWAMRRLRSIIEYGGTCNNDVDYRVSQALANQAEEGLRLLGYSEEEIEALKAEPSDGEEP